MKTLRQILGEVLLVTDIDKSNKLGMGKELNQPPPSDAKHISTMPTGHKVYHKQVGSGDWMAAEHHYYVTNREGNTVTKIKTEKSPRVKSEHIDNIAASDHPDRPKAHEIYHHLITHHNKILTSSVQSPGGHKIWKELSKQKNVSTHGWDYDNDKPINTDLASDDYEHETHVTHAQVKNSASDHGVNSPHHERVRNVRDIVLVASRKSKPKGAAQ